MSICISGMGAEGDVSAKSMGQGSSGDCLSRNALAWLPPYGVTAAPEKFDVLAFQGDCLVSKASVRLSLMASLPPPKT